MDITVRKLDDICGETKAKCKINFKLKTETFELSLFPYSFTVCFVLSFVPLVRKNQDILIKVLHLQYIYKALKITGTNCEFDGTIL